MHANAYLTARLRETRVTYRQRGKSDAYAVQLPL
jgi:hypothetical protein